MMTLTEQRIAIAEICGTASPYYMEDRKYVYSPEYPSNLDAMHAAKLTLTEDQLGQMLDHLCNIVRRDHNKECGPMTAVIQAFRATAEQEAEAFLLVFDINVKDKKPE